MFQHTCDILICHLSPAVNKLFYVGTRGFEIIIRESCEYPTKNADDLRVRHYVTV